MGFKTPYTKLTKFLAFSPLQLETLSQKELEKRSTQLIAYEELPMKDITKKWEPLSQGIYDTVMDGWIKWVLIAISIILGIVLIAVLVYCIAKPSKRRRLKKIKGRKSALKKSKKSASSGSLSQVDTHTSPSVRFHVENEQIEFDSNESPLAIEPAPVTIVNAPVPSTSSSIVLTELPDTPKTQRKKTVLNLIGSGVRELEAARANKRRDYALGKDAEQVEATYARAKAVAFKKARQARQLERDTAL